MLTLDQTVQIHPDVVDTELDEEIVLPPPGEHELLQPQSQRRADLAGLKQELSLKEMSQRLHSEFEVDAERPADVCLNSSASCPSKS
jgi:hypothetical protein